MENSQRNRSTASSNASSMLKLSPTPESSETESISAEWTDEKHSLYLKSMEASFVNQLYDSFDLLTCHLENEHSPSPSRKVCRPTCSPSGQYKVLQHGFLRKINFTRPSFQQNKLDGSRQVLASPWIKHFRSLSKLQDREAMCLNEKEAVPCALAEFSDQNFVDGDEGGENTSKSNMCGSKRMKTVEAGASSTDQASK